MGNLKTRNLATLLPVALAFVLGSAGVTQAQSQTGGPVRLARISYADGNVSYRPNDQISWTNASINQPIQQGAQLWASDGGRAELQFDDGSVLRLGNGAVVTLQTMNSDSSGEFTNIQVNQGTATMISRGQYSTYQIDGPDASLRTNGKADVRVDVNNGQRIIDWSGSVQVQDQAQQSTLQSGDMVQIGNTNDALNIQNAPGRDSWDNFNSNRNSYTDPVHRDPNLPYNISLVAGNLDNYGHWRVVAGYGNVWCPDESANWRPYWRGHWVWVDPIGWTWVGDEAWGWAPYHYGTWIHQSWGWGWCPGPVQQYWTPAAVSFCNYNGNVCWAPLCPQEVRYPSYVSIGFASGNWAFNFSIGGVACYTPTSYGYCEPHRFDWYGHDRDRDNFNYRNVYNNNTTIINNYYGNTYNRTINFVPRNAQFGAIEASRTGFASGSGFAPLGTRGANAFSRGAWSGTQGNRFGASLVVPNRQSLTPSRSFQQGNTGPASLGRRVFSMGNRSSQGQNVAVNNRNRGVTNGNSGTLGQRGNRWNWSNNQPKGSSQAINSRTNNASSNRWNWSPQKSSNTSLQRTSQSNAQKSSRWNWSPQKSSSSSQQRSSHNSWTPPQRTSQSNAQKSNRWNWSPQRSSSSSQQRSSHNSWTPPQRSSQSNAQKSNRWNWSPQKSSSSSQQRSSHNSWTPPQRTSNNGWNNTQRSSGSSWNSNQRSSHSSWTPPQRSNSSSQQRSNQSNWAPQRSNSSSQQRSNSSDRSRSNSSGSNSHNNNNSNSNGNSNQDNHGHRG